MEVRRERTTVDWSGSWVQRLVIFLTALTIVIQFLAIVGLVRKVDYLEASVPHSRQRRNARCSPGCRPIRANPLARNYYGVSNGKQQSVKIPSGSFRSTWSGESGSMGTSGIRGQKGSSGLVGERGVAGARGQRGQVGSEGARGPQGQVGERGSQGARGQVGNAGERGQVGSQGLRGPQGQVGEQGQRGSQGAQGQDGAVGARGMPGASWREEQETQYLRPELRSRIRGDQGIPVEELGPLVEGGVNRVMQELRLLDHPKCVDALDHQALMGQLKDIGKVSFMIMVDLQDSVYCIVHA